jgi:GNAT superfamily N-acetyltransferase
MEYLISTDPTNLNLDLIHKFLSEHSYWAQGIPRAVVARSIANSLCFGVYAVSNTSPRPDWLQVGFARVTTDRTTFAYLADVFILPEHRGQGLSKRLMGAILAHPDCKAYAVGCLPPRTPTSFTEDSGLPDSLSPIASCSVTTQTSTKLMAPRINRSKGSSVAGAFCCHSLHSSKMPDAFLSDAGLKRDVVRFGIQVWIARRIGFRRWCWGWTTRRGRTARSASVTFTSRSEKLQVLSYDPQA